MNKIENIKDMKYANDVTLVSTLINKWVKSKPTNKELLAVQQSFINIAIYGCTLQNTLEACKLANSDYREQRNQAVIELDEIKEDLKEYKI